MLGDGAFVSALVSNTVVPLAIAGAEKTMLAASSDLGCFCARAAMPLRFALRFSDDATTRTLHCGAVKVLAIELKSWRSDLRTKLTQTPFFLNNIFLYE